MGHEGRPDPDVLLRRVEAEGERASRARLKVFFGYAPGVGKTYAMLESACRLSGLGVDVVAGYVETHGRRETAELLAGLEVLPRRLVDHRGTQVAELDLDRALARRPAVLLVDELAHSNVPGSRHAKRWQDVEEILDAGIEVHTTLNVQHVESLNDVVSQITRVPVRETVPDAVLARAAEIEVVDLPPDELRVRLQEGKVYVPAEAERAAEHFFQRGNLLALRELALRRAAERVDQDVRDYRREHDIQATWPAAERILVCVGPSPSSAPVLRGACRMAAGLRAPWVAVYVDAPDAFPAGAADRDRLQAHLRLAESLGGEVVRLAGLRVSEEVLRYAREHNVTRIVIGKPRHSRWRDRFRGSLASEIVRGSGTIEIHFTAGDEGEEPPLPLGAPRRRVPRSGLALAAALVGGATGLGALGRARLAEADVVMLYLLAIMGVAVRSGRRAALAAAALSVAAYDFFFVPPFLTFRVEHTRHLLTFAMMFGVGLAIGTLTSRLRRRGEEAHARERRTAALYSLTRELAAVPDADRAAGVAARHAAEVFGGEAVVLLGTPSGGLSVRGASQGAPALSAEESGVIGWAADHARPAGCGTDTLPGSPVTAVPLRAGASVPGVLALRRGGRGPLDAEERTFLDTFARQVAIALERARLAEEARAAALRARTEELRSTLLSAVSHDLRTPLATITGAATTLRDQPDGIGPPQRAELLDAVCSEAARMERLIGNILDTVRLESGGVQPRREWVPIEEVVGSALARLDAELGTCPVDLHLPEDLPPAWVDPVLCEQVFVNLIENAVRHAGGDAPIEVRARATGEALEVEVADRGRGLPPGEEERVFERFYRGPFAPAGGVGLGLAICRGIVLAHGGTIDAANREGGGAVFRIRLPLGGTPPPMGPEGGEEATEEGAPP